MKLTNPDPDQQLSQDPPPKPPADPEGEAATTEEHQTDPPLVKPPILRMTFDFAVSQDDLARLSPEQIRSLFEAFGQLAAIKGALTD